MENLLTTSAACPVSFAAFPASFPLLPPLADILCKALCISDAAFVASEDDKPAAFSAISNPLLPTLLAKLSNFSDMLFLNKVFVPFNPFPASAADAALAADLLSKAALNDSFAFLIPVLILAPVRPAIHCILCFAVYPAFLYS